MADYNDEPECCPLCMEELDLTDQTFNACPCGYQVCLWCWHQIKNEYNGLCPACRQPYAELSKQKNPLDRDEVVRRTKQRKLKEKNDRRSAAQAKTVLGSRKSLQNVRVMQRNLVYVIGLPVPYAEEELLRSNACFGQYGKIVKAVVNKSHLNTDRANATASAYITFAQKEDALCCILAIDGFYLDKCLLRASFGTTKYCNFFLRNMPCNNSECLYLHELGHDDDSFTKEEMQSALHSGKAAFRDVSVPQELMQEREGTCFPPPQRPILLSRPSQERALSPARATDLIHSHCEDPFGDRQRHAQSVAAISKLRQDAGDNDTDTQQKLVHRTSTKCTRGTDSLIRGHSYSNIVAGGASNNTLQSTISGGVESSTLDDSIILNRPPLRMETSWKEEKTHAMDAVLGPLEALKLATGSSTEPPAWAKPFPTPAVSTIETHDVDLTPNLGGFNPFGLGFENTSRSDDVWGPSSPSERHLHSTLLTTSAMAESVTTSSSFASIDAIFSQRNKSSEALAGLLGVTLSPNPLAQSGVLVPPLKDAHTSRFSFANISDSGIPPPSARYELLNGTTVINGPPFSGFEASGDLQGVPSSSSGCISTEHSVFSPVKTPQHVSPRPLRDPIPSDLSHNTLPLSNGSRTFHTEVGGLAFLQQMLPNVNISFGGDYSSPSGAISSHVNATTALDCRENTGYGLGTSRRLFERSQSASEALDSSDAWSNEKLGDGGLLSTRRASSGSTCYDSTCTGFSSPFDELNAGNFMTSHSRESDRLRSDFSGDAFSHPGSLINN
ncbi:hypothetical protein CCR75_002313 [Bremia lactucae]|uniref:CCR4-NOT transcription complex subunit 4 n=1 Tax=Bremia lactucae TaxID=4779 RepID=A0A976FI18_BRELC|nr:hypothetical protein CCR75_002313 [Bremia lactucae]